MTDDRDDIWLDARERGESVDHIPQPRRARYERLEEHIAELPAEMSAPSGWQDRVLSQVRSPAPSSLAMGTSPPVLAPDIPQLGPKRRRTWPIVVGALAAAAVVLIVVLTTRPSGVDVSIAYVPQNGKTLGPEDEVHKTDVIVVRAHTDRIAAIRIYADHRWPIASCERCNVDGAIRASLETVGSTITVVTFAGCTPPPPSDEMRDRASATAQGCEVTELATTAVH